MSTTIQAGELIVQDPSDIRVYVFDWTDNLGTSVEISGAATWTLSVIDPAGATLITKDQESILGGNKKAQVRVQGGTADTRYRVACKITTNESPAQTKEQSFDLLVQNR